jgi:hypothetical protein
MLFVLRVTIYAIIAGVLAGIIGLYCGSALGYAIAWATGREPAELKDMLIWCFIGTSLVFATGAVWATLQLFKVNRWVKLVAAIIVCLTTLGAVSIATIAYIEATRIDRS